MLAVNVSFLAVPGVASQTQTATPIMILIYISTMCSVGSLMSSLLLMRRSRGQSSQTADEAVSPFVPLISFNCYRFRVVRLRTCWNPLPRKPIWNGWQSFTACQSRY